MQTLKTNNNKQWSFTKLADLVEYKKGKKPSLLEDKLQDGYVPYVDIEAFEKGVVHRYTNDKSAPISNKDTDILIVWDGARAGLVGKASGAIGSTLMKLTPKDMNHDFLLFFLMSKYREISTNHRGTGIPHVNPDIFWEIEVPTPDHDEQKAIATKISTLLPIIEQNKLKIAKAKRLVSKFRLAILSSATTGELTEYWRRSKGIDAYDDKGFPSDWVSTSIMNTLMPKGIFDGPFGSNLKTVDYVDSGVRVIRLENVGFLEFLDNKKTYVSEVKYQSLKKHTVYENDLIFSSFIVGKIRCCVMPKLNEVTIAKADCFCLRPNKEKVDVNFLAYLLSSKQTYDGLVSFTHGATRPRINTTQLRNLEILLPSLGEQKEIVKKINLLFEVVNKVEKQIEKAEAKVSKLTQAVLAKTFNGGNYDSN